MRSTLRYLGVAAAAAVATFGIVPGTGWASAPQSREIVIGKTVYAVADAKGMKAVYSVKR